MKSHNKKKKPVIWQDIVPVQKPKTPLEKLIYRIKKIKKNHTKNKVVKPPLQTLPIKNKPLLNNTKINHNKQKKNCLKFTRKRIIIAACIIAIIASFCIYKTINRSASSKAKTKTTSTTNKLVTGTPKYQTILPAGKTIKSLGGWTRVSPPKADPVYAYVDKIDNVSIDVSEQPLPEDFKTDTDSQIDQLAQSFKASEKITISGITIHIGTSSDGPQSIIFSKNNLLILIKSATKIDNNSWTQYINSMQ